MNAGLVPPVQRHGGAVIFTGQAVRDLAYLLPPAVIDAARRNGVVPPPRWRQILEAVAAAMEASACPASDVRSGPHSSEWLTTEQVAIRLGIDPRQVRRLGARIGGRKERGGWVFDSHDVNQEAQRRKAS